MRGLKLLLNLYKKVTSCRIFYRCVDWNSYGQLEFFPPIGRIFYRCVDWNCLDSYRKRLTQSHLLQMRGLKLLKMQGMGHVWVASFTDAWIETYHLPTSPTLPGRIFYRCVDWNSWRKDWESYYFCRIFYRCVDWNLNIVWHGKGRSCRIFYRCVDWNCLTFNAHSRLSCCRIFYRCVDWNCCFGKIYETRSGRIFYRCVDWNISTTSCTNMVKMSHLLQMRGLKLIGFRRLVALRSRIFYRCVDWNKVLLMRKHLRKRRIFYRCVDWNWNLSVFSVLRLVASFTDAWIETSIFI